MGVKTSGGYHTKDNYLSPKASPGKMDAGHSSPSKTVRTSVMRMATKGNLITNPKHSSSGVKTTGGYH